MPVREPSRISNRTRETRRAAQALAAIGATLLVAGANWASSLPEFLTFVLVTSAALLPGVLWIRSGAQGIPVLPAVAFLHILYFAVPVVRSVGLSFEYGPDDVARSAITVTLFLLAATVAAQAVVRRPRPSEASASAFAAEGQLPLLMFLGLSAGMLFHVLIILGVLGFLGPFFGVVRSVALTALTLSCYLLGVARARGQLRGRRWFIAASGLAIVILFSWSSFFLVGGLIYALAAGLGYVTTKKRVPWLLALAAFLLVAILHAGKGTMRDKYWREGTNSSVIGSITDLPGIGTEWISAGVQALLTDEEAPNVIERASLHQMLLRVQRLTPSFIPYLGGETYALLPRMLIPRFLSPGKTASQAAMDLLNIRYGLLSVEGVASTAIGWGLIAEAFANFGEIGVIAVGLVLGLASGLLMRGSAGSSALSRPTLLAIVGMMCLINLEADMAGLVTNLLQSVTAILIFFGVFRMFRGRQRRPANALAPAGVSVRSRA